MTKLVDQLVSECLHQIAAKIEQDPTFLKQSTNEHVAAALLCSIAHDAHPAFVLKALAALGVANTLGEIGQRLTAVREARTSAFQSAGIDIVAEHAQRQRASDEAASVVFEALRSKLSSLFAGSVTGHLDGSFGAAAAPAPTTTPDTPAAEPSQAVDALAAEFGSDAPPAAEPAPAPLATAVDAAA